MVRVKVSILSATNLACLRVYRHRESHLGTRKIYLFFDEDRTGKDSGHAQEGP